MKILFLFITIISQNLVAQSLGEDAYIRFYLGRSIQQSKLLGDTGLGKFYLFKNIPAYWVNNYQRTNALIDVQGLFGEIKPILTYRYKNSLTIDLRGSDLGEIDMSLRAAIHFKKITTHFNINGHWANTKKDNNQDGYIDLPLKKRLLVSNKWQIHLTNFTSINKIYFLGLATQSGQFSFDKKRDYLTTNAYGYGSNLRHLVGESTNYIATRAKDMIVINFKAVDHSQHDFYGLKQYKGREWALNTKAYYNYVLDNGFDIFKLGVNYQYKKVTESLDSLQTQRIESFGGGFVGYETFFGKKISLSTRLNIAHHNLAKWLFIPRLKINFKITTAFSTSLFGGNGIRFANVLSENQQFLISNRIIKVAPNLAAERAWYYGLSARYWVNLGSRFGAVANFQFHHTIYQNKIVVDLDKNAYQLSFYNLKGKAEKVSFELDLLFKFYKPNIGINIDYRLDWVHTTIDNQYRQEPLRAMHNLLINLDYRINLKKVRLMDISTSFYWNSPQRLPNTTIKNSLYGLISTPIFRWDMRLTIPMNKLIKTKSIFRNINFYVGIDNILNNIQALAPIASKKPFSPNFDAGLNWNTTVGRRFYGGFIFLLE